MKYSVLFDCDPGIDDAVAFALATAYPEIFDIRGITSVAGNQTIERVTGNALKLTSFLDRDIPVAKGCEKPLIREIVPAADIHGKTGLGNCVLPETDRKPVNEPAPVFLHQKLLELKEGEQMVLITTAPLTNISLLLKTFPDATEKIDKIVLMGGAVVGGNITSTAEFNIWEDPEAAQIVFSSGVPIVMCGLDVTYKCGFNRTEIQELLRGEEKARAFGEMLDFYFHTEVYTEKQRVAIHDAVQFMYLIHPEIFTAQEMNVCVDCSEGQNRGMTICDTRSWSDAPKNALVLTDADSEKFESYLMEAILSHDRK